MVPQHSTNILWHSKIHALRLVVPSTESHCDWVGCNMEDDKFSSLVCETSDRRRGVQTPRSGLSLFLVRFSCFSLTLPKPCKSFFVNLSSAVLFVSPSEPKEFVSFLATRPFGPKRALTGRGGRLPLSEFKIWIFWWGWTAVEDWLWRASLFKSTFLINLPPASRLWVSFGAVEDGELPASDVTPCCNKPSGTWEVS